MPILLDVCCGAGGSGVGFARAGFTVIGVDSKPQPRYPFTFVRADALTVLAELTACSPYWNGYLIDAIHFAPPCQAYGSMAHRLARNFPALIEPARPLLRGSGLPYVIENVPGAPLTGPILCGTMFLGLRVIRHRRFETNWPYVPPEHSAEHPVVFTYRHGRPGRYGDQNTMFVQVTGGGNARVANKRAAMGIWWMTGGEINEAVPPAYTEHIGRQLMEHLCPRD